MNISNEESDDDKIADASLSKAHFYGLLHYADMKEKCLLLLGLLFAAGAGIINPINILFFRDVVNDFTSQTFSYADIQFCVIRFAILGFVMIVATFVQAFLLSIIAKRLGRRIQYLCFLNLIKKDRSWFDPQSSMNIGSLIHQHVELIDQGIGVILGEFLQNICGLVAGVIVAFTEGWKLSLVASAILTIVLLFYGMIGFIANRVVQKERVAYEEAKVTSLEVLQSVRTVMVHGAEAKEVDRYASKLEHPEHTGVNRSLIVNTVMGGAGFAFFAAAGLVFWYGVTLMIEDNYQGGSVVAVFINILLGSIYMGNALPTLHYLKAATKAVKSLFDLIESAPTDAKNETVQFSEFMSSAYNIRLYNIVFAYPSDPNNPVLHHVSFDIDCNHKVALVGPPGSGKTTVFHLLLRFYEPDCGEILVSDMNIQSWDARKFRAQLGYVDKEPVLLEGTIRYNIRLGHLKATDAELYTAAKLTNVHEFIEGLDQGYDTPVSHLSGHAYKLQRWLIALARVLIRNPPLLLLEYPDIPPYGKLASDLLQAVQCASAGRTVVVASQYPQLVMEADQIVVLDKGLVKQTGSHAQLMESEDSLYAAMYRVYEPEIQTESNAIQTPEVTAVRDADSALKPPTKSKKKWHNQSFFLRLLRMNRPETGYIVGGCIASIIAGAAQPSFAVLYSEVFDVFLSRDRPQEMMHRIEVVSGLMALVGVSRLVACIGQGFFFGVSGERLVKRLRIDYFKAILNQEIMWFSAPDHQAEVLTAHLRDTVAQLRTLSGIQIGNFIEASALIVIALVISFNSSWQITLVSLAFLPLVLLGSLVQLRKLASKNSIPPAMKIINEVFANMDTIRCLNLEEYYTELYLKEMKESKRSEVKSSVLLGVVYSLTQSTGMFVLAAVFGVGAHLSANQSLSVLNLFRAFAVMNMSSQSIGKFFTLLPELKVASMQAELVLNTLERQPLINKDKGLSPAESDFTGRISFDHVTFKPPNDTKPSRELLENFSCTIEPDEVVGFVAPPGSGNIRILDLVLRFVDPAPPTNPSYGIYLDRWNIQQLAPSWIRAQSALISHDSQLFSRTIKENIAYGADPGEVTMDAIVNAARMANIHDFINTLPEGYDTVIGQGGLQFSAGQQRRVALARAFFRQPKLLLVDQATMGLDVESQRLIRIAHREYRKRATTLILPHELSHTDDFDRLVVIRGGHQVESGSVAELSQSQSYFSDLLALEKLKQF